MRVKSRAVLIVEAIVASFLMIFAFAAATQLFTAALQWEGQGTNVRRAALVAQKKMDELRAWSENFHLTAPFNEGWAAQNGTHPGYPEAPGFAIEVIAEPAAYVTVNPNRPAGPANPPPAGFYSPTSHFYTTPPAPPANPQKHDLWWTYPYARTMHDSMVRVEVTVGYGRQTSAGPPPTYSREFKLMSVIADPVSPLRPTPGGRFPQDPVSITGPGTLATVGTTGVYTVEVRLPNGRAVPDVTALWTVDSSGATVDILPTDSSGRSVTVTRTDLTPNGFGGTTRLAAKVRYRGKEIVGYSDPIDLP